MTFINIGASREQRHARSSAACTTRSVGGQLTGGKGRKGRKTPFPGPYSGGKEFPVFPAGRPRKIVSCSLAAIDKNR